MGYVERRELSVVHVHRLMRLGLVTESDGHDLVLMPAGHLRYEAFTRPLDLGQDLPNDLERLFALLAMRSPR